MLVKMAESNQMRDAQLVKHSERMDRMEILFERMHSQIPNMTRCVELCSEVGSSSTEIALTLTTIRDQTVTTAKTVSQRLDGMEDTIRDTLEDLKVEVLTAMLTSLENKIESRFTDVDVALAQLVSPPLPATETPTTSAPVPPDLLARPERPSSTTPADDADVEEASPMTRFQATTMFNPGSSFPPGNRVSHLDPRVDVGDHGRWRQREQTDWEDHPQSPWRHDHQATASDNFQDGCHSHPPSQRHLGEEDDVGVSHQQPRHRRDGRRDMRTDMQRDHHWSFDDPAADDDDEGYATMGGPIKSPGNIERF